MPFTVTTLSALSALLAQKLDFQPWITPEEHRLALNESIWTWNLLTGRWRRRVTLGTSLGTVEYALPATMVYGMRVLVGGVALTPSSELELDLARPNWRNESVAIPGDGVPLTSMVWAPVSLQRIAIWPSWVTTLNGLVVDGISAAPVLVEPGDTIDIDEATADLIVDFALHVMSFKEAGPRWRDTLTLYQQFLQGAAEENGRLKANQAFRRFAGLERGRQLQKATGVPVQNVAEGMEA